MESIQPRKRKAIVIAAAALSAVLLLAGLVGVAQFKHQLDRRPPLPPKALSFIWMGLFDAALLTAAAGGGLLYLATKQRWTWNLAAVMWPVSIGMNVLAALRCWNDLRLDPPRGDFAGPVALASLAVGVLLPGVIAITSIIAFTCHLFLRPQIALWSERASVRQ